MDIHAKYKMSFDDYVNHISQKIRVATAIAVLKSKPKNLNTLEYIEKLRINITPMEYDSDVTICSDDFDIESNDVTSVYVPDTHNIDDVTKNLVLNAPNIEVDNIKYINVNTKQNSIAHNDESNNYVINKECTENVIDHRTDAQKTSYAENVCKSNKVPDFVEILQELKGVDNSAVDKPNTLQEFRNLENPQTQNFIEDGDSDATYCETLPNTQIILNNNTLEETQIYSISDFTPFYTHYSESQVQNVAIESKLIYKNQNEPITPKTRDEFTPNSESVNDRRINEYNTKVHDPINLESNMTFSQNAQNSEFLSDLHLNQYNTETNNTFKPESNNISKIDSNFVNNLNTYDTVANSHPNNTKMGYNINGNKIIDSYNDERDDSILENKNSYNDTNIAYDQNTNDSKTNDATYQILANNIDIESYESDDLTDSQREIVPFKVIEELNKIKTYLKKRNDRRMSVDGSSDSGYRSDSQGRSSRNSIYSSTSINQSAHSLLTHIISCSLTTNTYEITKEVSLTLGSLIDKLHEDEIYPSFLEILLETITDLLRSVYEDEYNNLLLTKDEKIQRVLLLNKSAHIQKYTIDKITNILESIDTEANEINHTAKMENLCYIFHILEIILSKYKVENSQSQDSQGKVLKRSSITDIWRKKWNLSKEMFVENVEKKCALTKCSEVLNKMIVNCMEQYSLISFVALKCFNLLQP